MVFRVIYEASRNLGSPPPPRTDRVEACRPRGCSCSPSVALGRRSGRAPKERTPHRTKNATPGSELWWNPTTQTRRRGSGPPFEEPASADLAALRLGWRGLTPRWPRSLAARFRVWIQDTPAPRRMQELSITLRAFSEKKRAAPRERPGRTRWHGAGKPTSRGRGGPHDDGRNPPRRRPEPPTDLGLDCHEHGLDCHGHGSYPALSAPATM